MHRLGHLGAVQRIENRNPSFEAAGLASTTHNMSKCANVKSAPTDICDIANTIQAQLAVKGGTIISSDDKLTILRVY